MERIPAIASISQIALAALEYHAAGYVSAGGAPAVRLLSVTLRHSSARSVHPGHCLGESETAVRPLQLLARVCSRQMTAKMRSLNYGPSQCQSIVQ